MPGAPPELYELLQAPTPAEREEKWAPFVAVVTKDIRKTCHRVAKYDDDREMDYYAFTLEKLHADDFHRLRCYVDDARCQFTTWLAVVVGRLCHDAWRETHPRDHGPDVTDRDVLEMRLRLADLIAEELDPAALADPKPGPLEEVVRRELRAALVRLLEGLTERERLLLSLWFWDDRTYLEIAQLLEYRNLGYARRAIEAVVAKLKKGLTGLGFFDSDS